MTIELQDKRFAIQLMEHLVVPTFVLAASGQVIIWNHACERLTGIPASSVLGTNRHWSGFYLEPRPCLADLVLETASSERIAELYTVDRSDWETGADIRPSHLSTENWCDFRQGAGRRYIAIDAGPVHDETGRMVAVVETVRDITAQKEAQTALELLASQDGLTGIANRRIFDQQLETEWDLAMKSGGTLSLLMIDIDHFKPYNDALGHQRGDECLKRIAELIVSQTRLETDLVARYGGEEFAVILPRAEARAAACIARRILDAVREAAIPHSAPECPATLTLSIGIATCGPLAPSPERLIATADASLYRAKQNGRNRYAAGVRAVAA